MKGTSFKCNCGITISRRRDKSAHIKTQRHLLAIQQRKETKAVFLERDGCTHHWTIASASGPYSHGYCLRCGLQRQFPNSIETGSNWGQKAANRKQPSAEVYNSRKN